MATSKRDYVAVAKIIKAQLTVNRLASATDTVEALEYFAHELAGYLQQTNEEFDCPRFLEACGISVE